jgi:hypothetical protein
VLGTQLTTVAVPYQVYQLTHSSVVVGLVSLAQILPLIAGSLLGGSAVDAMGRRRLLMVAQVLMAGCARDELVRRRSRDPRFPVRRSRRGRAGRRGHHRLGRPGPAPPPSEPAGLLVRAFGTKQSQPDLK